MLTVLSVLACRWRGAGHLFLGRLACAVLIGVPLLLVDGWLALTVAGLSFVGVSADHDPGGGQLWLNSASGLLFTLWAALAWLLAGLWPVALLLAAAGLGKGALYRFVPRGPTETTKFLWRERAFGAAWGLPGDLALFLILLL